MILSNIEILKAIRQKELGIGDLTGEENPAGAPFNTSSIDLHLDSEITSLKGGPAVFDLTQKGLADFLTDNSEKYTCTSSQPFKLEPNQFVLGKTREKVHFPLDQKKVFAARVEGRSSVARCGVLVHFTAPTIHAGFSGTITLEMVNLSPVSFLLSPGLAICQLIIEEVKGKPDLTPSQFRGQNTAAGKAKK